MSGKNWIGLFFLLFGLGFLLQQTDVLDFSSVLFMWWPLILIIIGVIQLVNRSHSSVVSGLLFILIGGLFLMNQWVDDNLVAYLWPLILIFIGLTFIFSQVKREKPSHSNQSIQAFSLFSGTEVRSRSKKFEGGSATAIFGGSEIDLRDAIISDAGATLDLSTIFGGITIYVPRNVQVEVTGIPIFGGWENKTREHVVDNEELPILRVNCLTVFGGVEINN